MEDVWTLLKMGIFQPSLCEELPEAKAYLFRQARVRGALARKAWGNFRR